MTNSNDKQSHFTQTISEQNQEALAGIRENKCRINRMNMLRLCRLKENNLVIIILLC